MAKKISDADMLQQLLIHGSVKSTAAALKIAPSTVYERLKDPEFKSKYDSMQGVIISAAAASMAAALDDAVETLVKVMKSPETNAGIKVQAAHSLLTQCNRYIESANILKRLDELEKIYKTQGD